MIQYKHNNQKNMSEFALWFAYYDSIFLNPNPKLARQFYISHILPDAKWPSQACPVLAEVYLKLEQFVTNQSIWILSKCKLEQLQQIQTQLNELILFITLQKSYAHSFWEKDSRRIEASTVHFYTFLQMLIKSLIPYPTMSIFQCKTANKLCIKISQLQKLMNQILKCINPIAKFLSSPKFYQQVKLITNFFENWIYFMKKLPNIKRNKLNHVHKLVKFVCLTNPIQICTTNKSIEYEDAIRKKSNTIGTNLQLQTYPSIQNFRSNEKIKQQQQKKQKQQKQNQGKMKKKRKRSMSCASLVPKKLQQNNPNLQQENKKSFKLPDHILKYAIQQQNRYKKNTLSSLNSLKNKKQNMSKIRTMTTNETNSFSRFHPQAIAQPQKKTKRQKAKSTYQKRPTIKSTGKKSNKNSSFCAPRRLSGYKYDNKFYQKETERNQQILSVRSSKESTIRKREMSLMTVNKKQNGGTGYINSSIFFEQKPQIDLCQNKQIHKKWDKVRAYVKQLIKINRLKRIMSIN